MAPTLTEEEDPVTAMLVKVGPLTVTASVPDFPLKLAVMVAFPAANAETKPAAETLASVALEDVHAAWLVTSFVDPSL